MILRALPDFFPRGIITIHKLFPIIGYISFSSSVLCSHYIIISVWDELKKKWHLIVIICIPLNPREVKRIFVYLLAVRISSFVFAFLSILPSVTSLFLNYFWRSFNTRNSNHFSDLGIKNIFLFLISL